DVPVKEIVDPTFRAAWIDQKVELAKRQYMDGINIDIEQMVKKSSAEYYALTALVKETTEAFHREIPGSQVTFDVAWSPKCIDRRCYNYTGIADSCDFVFVMSYDEQSQVWTDCIARANAPYNQTLTGYSDYIHMGINPKKLVMGVPWYGYDYSCLSLSKAHICSIKEVSFRGAPCSDAAGRQFPYKVIMNWANSSMSGILWDEEQKAPYFEYLPAPPVVLSARLGPVPPALTSLLALMGKAALSCVGVCPIGGPGKDMPRTHMALYIKYGMMIPGAFL
ncbi:UNVERIFIED_CONTAM: hypothetical protein K2H54_044105, partial [Gekko kuhli]